MINVNRTIHDHSEVIGISRVFREDRGVFVGGGGALPRRAGRASRRGFGAGRNVREGGASLRVPRGPKNVSFPRRAAPEGASRRGSEGGPVGDRFRLALWETVNFIDVPSLLVLLV